MTVLGTLLMIVPLLGGMADLKMLANSVWHEVKTCRGAPKTERKVFMGLLVTPWAGENEPLLYLDRARRVPITFKRLFENVGGFGGTGSGKTSGPDASVAMGAMAGGAAMLISGPKHNSLEKVQDWAWATQRELDVVPIRPGVRFNVNDWLLRRKKDRRAVVKEVVDMVRELTTLSHRGNQQGLAPDHPFFSTEADRWNGAAVTIDLYSNQSMSVERVLKIMQTAPNSPAAARGASFCRDQCQRALNNASANIYPEVRKAANLLMIEIPTYDSRLRGDCLASAMVLWSALDRYPLNTMFTGKSDLTPDDMFKGNGKIFVVEMPISEGVESLIAFCIWKIALYKLLMDRCGKEDQRPCVVMLQEGQEYITAPSDYKFVATCREASACYYYSSQSVASAIAGIGEPAFNAMAACLNTQIFAQNPCTVTNDYASGLFGQYLKKKVTVSGATHGTQLPDFPRLKEFRRERSIFTGVKDPQATIGYEWEPVYRPEVFAHLLRGGNKRALVETRIRLLSEDEDRKSLAYETFFNQDLCDDPWGKTRWSGGRDIVTLA